jgi:hypothetical protein
MSNMLYELKDTIPDSTYKALYDALNEDLYYEHTIVHGPDTDDDDEQAKQARQAEFERKSNEMERLFPNLPFSPDIDDLDRLDQEVYVSEYDFHNATIFHENRCYCCRPEADGGQIININRDRNITYRDVYTECERQWTEEMCNHMFLEHIDAKHGTITLHFGS